MLCNFTLDRIKVILFSKLLDTLRAFIPDGNLNFNEKGLSFSNLDSTHTVVAAGMLNSDFLSKFEIDSQPSEPLALNLNELYKILKSSTKLVAADFQIYNDKVEIQLIGSSQRQKSLFNIDTYHSNGAFDSLCDTIQANISEYEHQLKISSIDFKEILTSLKIFKSEQVTIQYQKNSNKLIFLTGDHNQHKIEYILSHELMSFQLDELIIEDENITEETIELQLSTERLLNLSRAQLSTNLLIALKSEYHPVYFCFHIDNDSSNQLIIGLSPRNC